MHYVINDQISIINKNNNQIYTLLSNLFGTIFLLVSLQKQKQISMSVNN